MKVKDFIKLCLDVCRISQIELKGSIDSTKDSIIFSTDNYESQSKMISDVYTFYGNREVAGFDISTKVNPTFSKLLEVTYKIKFIVLKEGVYR